MSRTDAVKTGLAFGRGSLLCLGMLLTLPCGAFAQNLPAGQVSPPGSGGSAKGPSGAADLLEKRVSLDMEEGRLSDAIRAAMKSVGANYSLDPALRGATLSAHLQDVRLRVALDTLMKASSLPATYTIEDGVYHFALRVDGASQQQMGGPAGDVIDIRAEPVDRSLFIPIAINFMDPGLMAQILGGKALTAGSQSFGVLRGNLTGGLGGSLVGDLGGETYLLGSAGAGFNNARP